MPVERFRLKEEHWMKSGGHMKQLQRLVTLVGSDRARQLESLCLSLLREHDGDPAKTVIDYIEALARINAASGSDPADREIYVLIKADHPQDPQAWRVISRATLAVVNIMYELAGRKPPLFYQLPEE